MEDPPRMRGIHPLRTFVLGALALVLPADSSRAVEPGIDIAAPRVAIATVGAGFIFSPARLVVERQDHVRWMPTAASVHNTVSGASCTANGLWSASLGPSGSISRASFSRRRSFPTSAVPTALALTWSDRWW